MMFASFYLEFLSFIIGCILIRKKWPLQYKLLVLLTILAFAVEWVSTYWSSYFRSSNHWMYNIYWPLEAATFLYILQRSSVHRLVRRFNTVLLAAVLPVLVAAYLWSPHFYILNLRAGVGCSILLLLSACSTHIGLLLNKEEVSIFSYPVFWLAAGVLVYSLGNSMYYAAFMATDIMFLHGFIGQIYFSAISFLNVCIMACFICLFLQGPGRLSPAKGV